MKITPEHQRAFEKNAQPVYVVNQLSFIDMILAVAIGVALGTFGMAFILRALDVL
jgi:hypothetical protein